MSKFIIGKKLHMSRLFLETGEVVPVTVIQAGPCMVTAVKTKDRDGYEAIQIGYEVKKKIAKPQKGHLKGLPDHATLREFRVAADEVGKVSAGDIVAVATFETGDVVAVSGVSKGKGFQGVVKRHGFSGSPASHGHKDQLRMPGSIGATDPAHVFKGKKMAGQMGNRRATVSNVEVVRVDKENNLLYVKGGVPGSRGSLLALSGAGELVVTKREEKERASEKADRPQEREERKAGSGNADREKS